MRYVPIVSPANGYIVEKEDAELAVEPGMLCSDREPRQDLDRGRALRQVPFVKVGQPATMRWRICPTDLHRQI
jgi:hypothetical protein